MESLFSEFVSFIIGVVAGVGLKFVIDRRRTDRSVAVTVQRDNRVGGHQAGRDISVGDRDSTE